MKTQRIVIEAEKGDHVDFLKSRMIETWNWYGRQPIMQGYHNGVLYEVDSKGEVFMKSNVEWGKEYPNGL